MTIFNPGDVVVCSDTSGSFNDLEREVSYTVQGQVGDRLVLLEKPNESYFAWRFKAQSVEAKPAENRFQAILNRAIQVDVCTDRRTDEIEADLAALEALRELLTYRDREPFSEAEIDRLFEFGLKVAKYTDHTPNFDRYMTPEELARVVKIALKDFLP